ncbi:MAG: hypothetical protein DMG31_00810 [Acidobacteria bacterium]|nr:MAG: hypothetical protein DMG31_00810 [Acidobacteriota bacterium]
MPYRQRFENIGDEFDRLLSSADDGAIEKFGFRVIISNGRGVRCQIDRRTSQAVLTSGPKAL